MYWAAEIDRELSALEALFYDASDILRDHFRLRMCQVTWPRMAQPEVEGQLAGGDDDLSWNGNGSYMDCSFFT